MLPPIVWFFIKMFSVHLFFYSAARIAAETSI